jgi:hypothetical protein
MDGMGWALNDLKKKNKKNRERYRNETSKKTKNIPKNRNKKANSASLVVPSEYDFSPCRLIDLLLCDFANERNGNESHVKGLKSETDEGNINKPTKQSRKKKIFFFKKKLKKEHENSNFQI